MKEKIGDIFEVTEGIICHGVNCQGVMRSGIAKEIRERWPIVFDRYKEITDINKFSGNSTSDMLGKVQLVLVAPGLWVANCFTQDRYGRPDSRKDKFNQVRYVSYDAVDDCMKYLRGHWYLNGIQIHLPLIGGGLGGGSGAVLREIYSHWLNGVGATLYYQPPGTMEESQ